MPKVLLLIVEDEANIAELYAVNFEKAGYQVDIAHNGLDGFEKIKLEHPSIVLMDILMPGLSGNETIEKVKEDPALKNTPFIMLSNYSNSTELKNAMDLGALDYIIKAEYTPSQVVEKVTGILDELGKAKNGKENKNNKHKYLQG